MDLPNLPKKYNRKEAKIDSLVIDWFVKHYDKSVAIEVKIKGNKALPHQQIALNQVQKGIFAHKMPDMGRVLPFDGFVLKDADAFIVTCEGRICVAVRQSPDDPLTFDFHL